jgi:hypothetical protein
MAERRGRRNLDLEVQRHGRREDRFQAAGDPEDIRWLEARLAGWLEANRWHRNKWDEFEIMSRDAGEGRVLTRARAR